MNDERIKAKDKDIEQIDAGDSVKWDRELKSRRVHWNCGYSYNINGKTADGAGNFNASTETLFNGIHNHFQLKYEPNKRDK